MKKTNILTVLLVLLTASTVWAGDSVSIAVSCTIPSIPGVNAPASRPEVAVQNALREDVVKNNSAATVGEEFIEKEERKENLLAQGEKVTSEMRTIYTR